MPRPSNANNFDLVRLVLSLLVVYSHSYHVTEGRETSDPLQLVTQRGHTFGMLAVDGFFTVSGYLIARSWVCSPGVPFLRNCALRILPAFWLSCIVSVILAAISCDRPLDYLRWLASHPDSALRTALLIPGGSLDAPEVYPGTHYPGAVNGPYWTLPLEVVCYAVVAVAGSLGLFSRWSSLVAYAVCWVGYIVVARHPDHGEFTLVRLGGFFAAGAFLSHWSQLLRRG